MAEDFILADQRIGPDEIEVDVLYDPNPTRLFTPSAPKQGETCRFAPNSAKMIPLELTAQIAERIRSVCPELLKPYLAGPNNEVEGVLLDDRLDIRVDRFSANHVESQTKAKPIECVIIKDIALMHYRGVTLSPSLKGYKMGQKIAKMLPETGGRVLEIGTGTGMIGLSALQSAPSNTHLTATDIDPRVLAVAEINAQLNGMTDQCRFQHSDLFENVHEAPFDLIVSNPPFSPSKVVAETPNQLGNFVELGPPVALDGGEDGLELYQRIMEKGQEHLKPGGKFVFQVHKRGAQGVRSIAHKVLGRRLKSSCVMSENKTKRQLTAHGFMVVIEIR